MMCKILICQLDKMSTFTNSSRRIFHTQKYVILWEGLFCLDTFTHVHCRMMCTKTKIGPRERVFHDYKFNLLLTMKSLEAFAHASTAQLPCHVQKKYACVWLLFSTSQFYPYPQGYFTSTGVILYWYFPGSVKQLGWTWQTLFTNNQDFVMW